MASKTRKALETKVEKPRGWGQPTKPHALRRPWYGLDTERDALTGEFVCGFAVGEETHRFETIRDLPPGTYWVWNLAYDIEGMIRDLDEENGWCMRSDAAPFTIGKARCVYYHGKRFEWADEDGKRLFLEASSFFGRMALQKAATKVFGEGKDTGVDASKMSLERYGSDRIYRAAVDKYCLKDAKLVFDLLETLDEGVSKAAEALGSAVGLGATPGATARRFLTTVGAFPDILWRTQSTFLKAYCGGRFEISKRGFFQDVYQYDLVSAYPWALTQCPFLTDSAQQRFTRRLGEDAQYGAYLVSFDTDEYLGLAPQWRGETRVYSAAEEKTWLSRPEVEWLHMNNYDYEIHRGMEVWDENASNLWAEVVSGLFDLKTEKRGQPDSMGAKIVLNSLYGIMIQLVPNSGKWVPLMDAIDPVSFVGDMALEKASLTFMGGKYYAPLYASHLTALTRVRLLDAANSVGDAYIGGHTDSIITTQPLKMPLGRRLGDWDLEKKAEELVITKTGLYAMDDAVKSRGIDKGSDKTILWAPKQKRKVRTGVKTARSWGEVSLIQEKEVANNLEYEKKREWLAPFSADTIHRQEWIDSNALKMVGQ